MIEKVIVPEYVPSRVFVGAVIVSVPAVTVVPKPLRAWRTVCGLDPPSPAEPPVPAETCGAGTLLNPVKFWHVAVGGEHGVYPEFCEPRNVFGVTLVAVRSDRSRPTF